MAELGFDFDVEGLEAAFDFKGRTEDAFEAAGQAYKRELSSYPPPPPIVGLQGTGVRTNQLANSLSYEVDDNEESFKGATQGAYMLQGTGIYGPTGAPIVPKSGRFLTWQVGNPAHPLFGTLVHAKSVRGAIWQGKKETLLNSIVEGFMNGFYKR